VTVNPAEEPLDLCWKRIGVWGDKSCPRLPHQVHCRNCEVYAAAAARLLDRPPPAGYWEEWTARVAAPRQSRRTGTHSVVVFRLGQECLALPVRLVQEVAERRPVRSLPHRQGRLVRGLVNVRGELLICISLGELLGIGAAPTTAPREHQGQKALERLLVAASGSERLAFPADEVYGIERYHPDDLQSVPATVSLAAARYSTGLLPWRDRSVGVLDHELVLYTINRSLG
jgi:chemotaxis-related protein WspD